MLNVPDETKPPQPQVMPHISNDPDNENRLPSLFIAIQAIVKPGISMRHTNIKLRYLLPLKFCEFNERP